MRWMGFLLLVLITSCSSFVVIDYNPAKRGRSFTESELNTRNIIHALAYGDKRWLALGDDIILRAFETSSKESLFRWENSYKNKKTSVEFRDAAFNQETWVVVGSKGTILTSQGSKLNWKKASSGTTVDLFKVAYGNGYWLVLGDSIILGTSNPTGEWKEVAQKYPKKLLTLAYGEGLWVVIGLDLLLFSKSPLAKWEKALISPTGLTPSNCNRLFRFMNWRILREYTHLTYGNGIWVLVDTSSAGCVRIQVTKSPYSYWQTVYEAPENFSSRFGPGPIIGIAYGEGLWLAIDDKAWFLSSYEPADSWTHDGKITGAFRSLKRGHPVRAYSIAYGNGYWMIAAKRYSRAHHCFEDFYYIGIEFPVSL